jgi:hypothetical protein
MLWREIHVITMTADHSQSNTTANRPIQKLSQAFDGEIKSVFLA